MRKEKREKRVHVYEANGPVAQLFGVCFALGARITFQRLDNGCAVHVIIAKAERTGVGDAAVVRFNGTLLGMHDGEAVIGEYNTTTGKTTLTTWFEL